jgi:hypothetical protein
MRGVRPDAGQAGPTRWLRGFPGGSVCELSGTALRYGKPGFDSPHFVAAGRDE